MGPFDFKSIRATTATVSMPETAVQAGGADGCVPRGGGVAFGERAKTPVNGASPKGKERERAKSVDLGIFTRAKTPVGVASPRDSSGDAHVDTGRIVHVHEPSLDVDDVATPRQGRKRG